mgnify:CR=1 FL=1
MRNFRRAVLGPENRESKVFGRPTSNITTQDDLAETSGTRLDRQGLAIGVLTRIGDYDACCGEGSIGGSSLIPANDQHPIFAGLEHIPAEDNSTVRMAGPLLDGDGPGVRV